MATSFILVLVTTAVFVISTLSVQSTSSAAGSTLDTSKDRQFENRGKWDWNRGRKNFTCPWRNGRYPHPESCEYYYECRYGRATIMTCDGDYHYDEELRHCRDKTKVNCKRDNKGIIEEEVTFKCPRFGGTFAHPTDCSKYFVCFFYMETLHECTRTELFDENARKCLHASRVNCGKRSHKLSSTIAPTTQTTLVSTTLREIPVTTTTVKPITTADPTTTIEPTYISTAESTTATTIQPTTTTSTTVTTITTTETTLQPTTVSSSSANTEITTEIPVTKANTPPPLDCNDDDLDCIVDKTGDIITMWFECPKKNGFYPHGSSKKLFIHCSKWKPVIKRCTEGTVFIPEYESCTTES